MSFLAPIISGIMGSNAAGTAASQQVQAQQNGLAYEQNQFNSTNANYQPYVAAGQNALGTLESQMPALTEGFNPTAAGIPSTFSYGANQFQTDPGYQFALQQGQQAIHRSAAATGGALGGGTMKALDQYTTGLASQQYGQAYQRAQNTYQQNYGNAFDTFETNQNNAFNRLSGTASMGLNATNQLANYGSQFANNAANIETNMGNALSAGTMGKYNAVNGMVGGLNSLANQYLANYASGYGG
jgi:hypothetical protein